MPYAHGGRFRSALYAGFRVQECLMNRVQERLVHRVQGSGVCYAQVAEFRNAYHTDQFSNKNVLPPFPNIVQRVQVRKV